MKINLIILYLIILFGSFGSVVGNIAYSSIQEQHHKFDIDKSFIYNPVKNPITITGEMTPVR